MSQTPPKTYSKNTLQAFQKRPRKMKTSIFFRGVVVEMQYVRILHPTIEFYADFNPVDF